MCVLPGLYLWLLGLLASSTRATWKRTQLQYWCGKKTENVSTGILYRISSLKSCLNWRRDKIGAITPRFIWSDEEMLVTYGYDSIFAVVPKRHELERYTCEYKMNISVYPIHRFPYSSTFQIWFVALKYFRRIYIYKLVNTNQSSSSCFPASGNMCSNCHLNLAYSL